MINTKNKSGQAQDKNKQPQTPGHDNMPKENPGKTNSKEEILYPRESEAAPQERAQMLHLLSVMM